MNLEIQINRVLTDLFPINRSITGAGVRETLEYIKNQFIPEATIIKVGSGTEVFDWRVPDEWGITDAYVKNKFGEKIIDFSRNNLHVVSYSTSVSEILDEEKLLEHLHTLPQYPDWIPYRTSYYNKSWGFCCAHSLLETEKFQGPFEVKIDAEHNSNGSLNWLECLKKGELEKEILISTYCCHPSLANDNLSGIVGAIFLFDYLKQKKTRYSYRLLILPETIGAICFLSRAAPQNVIGGMILSCLAGPDELSLKEGFDKNHWINKAAHLALKDIVGPKYKVYPFVPDGSDERQYSSPAFRIVTPSIHKSKYYEYVEYHTSADDLTFISSGALAKTLEVYKRWIDVIDTYNCPVRYQKACEYQLGKRGLYPLTGGTLNQKAHTDNLQGFHNRAFNFNQQVELTGAHLDTFHWLMHLADGSMSNFDIAERAGINLDIVNEAIATMYQKGLLKLT